MVYHTLMCAGDEKHESDTGSRQRLHIGSHRSTRWPGMGTALERHPFSRLVGSAYRVYSVCLCTESTPKMLVQ